MAKKSAPPTISDEQVKALLDRYHCPVSFHAVRTRFLGNIASPDVGSSPVEMLKALWGGALPPFDNLDAANELMAGLVMGLWNRPTPHQERSAPFRLMRLDVLATRDGLAKLAILRREEIDGFVQGLFGDSESLDLPERAHRSLEDLAQMREMFEAVRELVEDHSKSAEADAMAVTLGHFRDITRNAEHEIHEAVLSCTRARRQILNTHPTMRPTRH